MYESEPVSPIYGISEAVVTHRLRGGEHLRTDLPGSYRLTLPTRELHGPVQAALAAPPPTGPARICTARFSASTPLPAMSRILDTVRGGRASAGAPLHFQASSAPGRC